jgi:ATP-binding cassette subfamily C protein
LRYVVTLGRILDATPEPEPVVPLREAPPVHTVHNGLAVRGLTFAYGPHAEPVLRDLDLDVPDGDHLTIVGPSGIGKSTLAGLLCGLLPPDTGTVTLGGVPLSVVTAPELAASRVLIPQEAYVFTGTVHDNLVYLRPDASVADVRRAVAAVGADHLIDRLGGLDALVNPAELSSGERQLLALVRAYLSAAPVVVLDEATCHLDGVAERRAEEAFAARHGTLIVIAHRMSSALRAKRVLILDGNAAIVGDHDTVRATSPLYRELLGFWDLDPTRLLGSADRLDPVAGAHLRVDAGQAVPHRTG